MHIIKVVGKGERELAQWAQCHLRDDYIHSSRWTFAASFRCLCFCNFLHAISQKDQHAHARTHNSHSHLMKSNMKKQRIVRNGRRNKIYFLDFLERGSNVHILQCDGAQSIMITTDLRRCCSIIFSRFVSRVYAVRFRLTLSAAFGVFWSNSRSFSVVYRVCMSYASSWCLQGCIVHAPNVINTRIWFLVLSVQQMRFFIMAFSCVCIRLKRKRDRIGIMGKSGNPNRVLYTEIFNLKCVSCVVSSVSSFHSVSDEEERMKKKNKTRELFYL